MTALGALASWLEAMRDCHVLCVGDVMLDRYEYGAVARISPEAPIPVVRIEGDELMLGGAGNVVRNVTALGGAATLVSVRGDDPAGTELAQLLAAESRLDARVTVESGRITTIKTRYIADGQQLLRADRETARPVARATENAARKATAEAVERAGVVVLSDYAKGLLSNRLIAAILELAKRAGVPVLVDPKGGDFGRYRGASVLTPNLAELEAVSGGPCGDDDAVTEAARATIRDCGIAAVTVTRGERGMTLVEGEAAAVHLATRGREVYSRVGAGDTVIATVACALAAGAPLAEAAALANVAAGIVVDKVGTAVAYPSEIAQALHAAEHGASESKIVALTAALDRVETWRRRGDRIGFTNGCFDLLHPGHVALLEQARAACDRLVVGLNSDASARRLKGPGRPVNTERERAVLLASHGVVDLVVGFAEDTPIDLIAALKPEVLVKGADYSLDAVVGADLVRSHGGTVILAKIKPGYSTTGALAKLAR